MFTNSFADTFGAKKPHRYSFSDFPERISRTNFSPIYGAKDTVDKLTFVLTSNAIGFISDEEKGEFVCYTIYKHELMKFVIGIYYSQSQFILDENEDEAIVVEFNLGFGPRSAYYDIFNFFRNYLSVPNYRKNYVTYRNFSSKMSIRNNSYFPKNFEERVLNLMTACLRSEDTSLYAETYKELANISKLGVNILEYREIRETLSISLKKITKVESPVPHREIILASAASLLAELSQFTEKTTNLNWLTIHIGLLMESMKCKSFDPAIRKVIASHLIRNGGYVVVRYFSGLSSPRRKKTKRCKI